MVKSRATMLALGTFVASIAAGSALRLGLERGAMEPDYYLWMSLLAAGAAILALILPGRYTAFCAAGCWIGSLLPWAYKTSHDAAEHNLLGIEIMAIAGIVAAPLACGALVGLTLRSTIQWLRR